MSIYLDNGATSYPKPECVYTAVNDYMRYNGTSPGRGNYARAIQAEQLVYETRKNLSKLLGIKKSSGIILTSSVTESINTVLKGFLSDGDTVVTTNIEHNAMWRPLKKLEKDKKLIIKQVCCSPIGTIDLDIFKTQLSNDVKLVAIIHGSNVLGNLLPIRQMIQLAHEFQIPVLVDAAQTVGVYPINVKELEVDFFTFTGHKGLLGPPGTGGLYIRDGLLVETLKEGGTGSMSKSPYQPHHTPDRFESGTMNIWGIAGLHASTKFLLDTSVEQIRSHEQTLLAQLVNGLLQLQHITVYGPHIIQERLGVVSFNIHNHDPYKVAMRLDNEFNIMVRAGLHCAPNAHSLIGTIDTGTIRASIGYFNTAEHIDTLLEALKTIIK